MIVTNLVLLIIVFGSENFNLKFEILYKSLTTPVSESEAACQLSPHPVLASGGGTHHTERQNWLRSQCKTDICYNLQNWNII